MFKQLVHGVKGPENRYHALEGKVVGIDHVEWTSTPSVAFRSRPRLGLYESKDQVRIWHDVLIKLPGGTILEVDKLAVPLDVIHCSFDMDDT